MPKQANPLRPGDTAYHPSFGKVKVLALERGVDIQVQDHGKDYIIPQWTVPALLSFTPWPEPVHTRPIEDGYWLVQFKDFRRTYLAQYTGKDERPWQLVSPDGSTITDHSDSAENQRYIKPVAYLGAKLEWWQA